VTTPAPAPPERPPADGPAATGRTRAPLAWLRARGSKRGPRPSGPPGPWVLLAAWGPCGYAPIAPGTFGTLGAIPLYWALTLLPWPAYLAAAAAVTALGVAAAGRAGRYWGHADASPIVIDEVAGYLVTMALVPFSWPAALAGFALFRLFDVVKPWPASALDRVKSGFGVVMDDVAAGVYAWAALQLLRLALRLALGCGPDLHWWCVGVGA
jgi:phosphatidylglycerophosphatase A